MAHLDCCTAGLHLSQIWRLVPDQSISWFCHLLAHSDISLLCFYRVGETIKLLGLSSWEQDSQHLIISQRPMFLRSSHMNFRGETHFQIHSKSHLPQLPGSGKKGRVSLHGDLAGISWSRPNTLNYEHRGHLGALRLGEF